MPHSATHPFLHFRYLLDEAPRSLWLQLGEATACCDHVAGTPLEPDVAANFHRLFLVKGALGTAAIEGNTLSEADVAAHLAGELNLPQSQQYLAQEIDNVVTAHNDVIQIDHTAPITLADILDMNRRILYNLPLKDSVESGVLRDYRAGVGNYGAPGPEHLQSLMTQFVDWLSEDNPAEGTGMSPLQSGILRAMLAHLILVWIHPFGDGNGRTARLLEFRLLLRAGVPLPSAHLPSDYYNRTREIYYRVLDQASSKGDYLVFVRYAILGFVEQLRGQLDEIRVLQLKVAWRSYVFDQFRETQTSVGLRRRSLVLDLSDEVRPVARKDLSQISPRVATLYAGKSARVMTQDLNELVKMKLVEKVLGGRYRARTERVVAFLPYRHRSPEEP